MTDQTTMRDIREDIRERLALVERKIADFQRALQQQEEIKASYERILALEEARAGFRALNVTQGETKPPVADFIIGLLRGRPRTKDELTQQAEQAGYYADGSVGRAVHMALVNMERSGRIREVRGHYEEIAKD